jgi:DNA-binding transcriptional ArsR family regulator
MDAPAPANPVASTPPAPLDRRLRQELEELVAQMCNAINEPKRLMVIYALGAGPRTVNELAEILEAPQSNTSQHLAVLRNRGLVDVQRRGSHAIYSLRYPKIIEAIDLLRDVLSEEIARQHALRSA